MASVGDVAGAVAALIARHETLRTTFVPGERPRQRVAGSGVFVVEACSLGAGEWGPADRPAVAGALVRWLRESPDPGRPVRVAVAVAPRRPGDRLRGRVHAPGRGPRRDRDHQARLRRPARRPRRGGRPARRGISRWTRLSWRRRPPSGPGRRRRWTTCKSKPGASRVACIRCRVPGRAASRWRWSCSRRPRRWRCGGWRRGPGPAAPAWCWRRSARWSPAGPADRELVFPLVSSNRFEAHLATYVGPLAQGAAATVEIAGRSFDELVRHTWTTVLEASRLARYDTARRDATNQLIEHERGLRLNLDPFFNSLVPESWSGLTAGVGVKPEEIGLALARTELRWRPALDGGVPLRFSLNQVDGCLRLDAWSGDAGLLPRAELEAALLAVERLLVAAAHGDVTAGQVPGVDRAGAHRRSPRTGCWPTLLGERGRRAAPGRGGRRARRRPGLRLGRRPAAGRLPGRHRHRPDAASRPTPAAWPPWPATPPPSPPATTSSAPPHRPTRPTPPPGHRPWPPAPAAPKAKKVRHERSNRCGGRPPAPPRAADPGAARSRSSSPGSGPARARSPWASSTSICG